jgi:Mg2+/Co2+ transporter CorB
MAKKDMKNFYSKYNMSWVLIITFWTFLISVTLSIFAESLVNNLDVVMSFAILLFFILTGILFDIIGIAVTTADEKPFHAMAANKIDEARTAIKLVRNSSQVSNFCNDVIGDISGIISGAVATSIIYKLIARFGFVNGSVLTILLTGLTASLTVGGKGIGKSVAAYHYEKVIYKVAKIIGFVERLFGLEFMPSKKKSLKTKGRKNKEID